jgi:hypothetical protein
MGFAALYPSYDTPPEPLHGRIVILKSLRSKRLEG